MLLEKSAVFIVVSVQLSVLSFRFSGAGLSVVRLSVYTELMIRDVTDLEIYNLGLENLSPLYRLTILVPPEHRKIKYQANEAGEKIPAQIAEGFGKKSSPREFCRFLLMALGSSDEVITHIREIKILSQTYSRINPEECDKVIECYKKLSKKINKLHSSWRRFD